MRAHCTTRNEKSTHIFMLLFVSTRARFIRSSLGQSYAQSAVPPHGSGRGPLLVPQFVIALVSHETVESRSWALVSTFVSTKRLPGTMAFIARLGSYQSDAPRRNPRRLDYQIHVSNASLGIAPQKSILVSRFYQSF